MKFLENDGNDGTAVRRQDRLYILEREGKQMRHYEKPVVMIQEGFAEGVYLASGADAGNGGASDVTYTTRMEDAWSGVKYCYVTVTNATDAEKADWQIVLTAEGTLTGAQIYNGWLASAAVDGSKITVTPGGGGVLAAGASVEIQVVVNYSGDTIVVK